MSALTPREEKAVQYYMQHGEKSDAYRHAYKTENMKSKTVNEAACRLFAKSKIIARVKELQERIVEKHDVTMESILDELEAARSLAMKDPKGAGAAVSATMGKAKLCGLIVDKKEDVTPKRTKQEIDARISELIAGKDSRRASGPTGAETSDREADETFPTVPGHGTA